jgi:polyhydroxyalkanoate synthase
MRQLHGGPVRFILTGGGHIAGIINPPDKRKRGYRSNDDGTTDPQDWLSGATEHEGSWWPDWIPWLEGHSGDLVAPPTVGSREHPPVTDAPGLYVLEQ